MEKCFCYSGLGCEVRLVEEPSTYFRMVASPPASPLYHKLPCLITDVDIHISAYIVLYEYKLS